MRAGALHVPKATATALMMHAPYHRAAATPMEALHISPDGNSVVILDYTLLPRTHVLPTE